MTEKRRAEDEMRRRNRELNALNAMAVVAAQSFDLDEILNLTLRQVVTLFGAESGTVYLSDSDATRLTVAGAAPGARAAATKCGPRKFPLPRALAIW
jgi:GAF domain-containing protein